MSFVSLGGDGSTRPTFFELVAAERLMPSLKAATVYSLSVRCSSSRRGLDVEILRDRRDRQCHVGACAKKTHLPSTAGLRERTFCYCDCRFRQTKSLEWQFILCRKPVWFKAQLSQGCCKSKGFSGPELTTVESSVSGESCSLSRTQLQFSQMLSNCLCWVS